MRRTPGSISSVFICIFILTAGCFLLAGCGAGNEIASLTGLDLFNAARDNLEQVDSFKMTVTLIDDSTGDEGGELFGEPVGSEATAEAIFEKTSDGESLCMARIDGGKPVYITQEGTYREVNGKWRFTPETPSDTEGGFLSNPLDSLDPEGLMGMMDMAGEIETVEETDSVQRYRFFLDPEKIVPEPSRSDLKQLTKLMDMSEEDAGAWVETVRESFSDAFLIGITVDKASGLISEATMSAEVDYAPMMQMYVKAGLISPEEAAEMFLDMEMSMSFSEYGKKFDLELPEEAIKARNKSLNRS